MNLRNYRTAWSFKGQTRFESKTMLAELNISSNKNEYIKAKKYVRGLDLTRISIYEDYRNNCITDICSMNIEDSLKYCPHSELRISFVNDNAEYLFKNKLFTRALHYSLPFYHYCINFDIMHFLLRHYGKDGVKIDNKDKITENTIKVFRGVVDEAYKMRFSWTLDIEKAKYFSDRTGKKGFLYSATVNKEDIICYITDRNEEEILVLPENLKEIQEIYL